MHPKTRIRNKHYLKRVKSVIEKRNDNNDVARYFIAEFGKSNHEREANKRPILDDEHRA